VRRGCSQFGQSSPGIDQPNSPAQRIAKEEIGLHRRRSADDRDGHACFWVFGAHLEVQRDLRRAIRHRGKHTALDRGGWLRDVRLPTRVAEIRETAHTVFGRRTRYDMNEGDREARRRRIHEEGIDRREALERDV